MKVAFVDQAYHEKTKSSDFFKEFLESNFQVDYHWIYTWKDRKLDYDSINGSNYDAIIFWQVIPKPGKMRRFTCQNLIYIPMYDSVITKSDFNWYLYQIQGVKIISFSKFLYHRLVSLKFKVLHVKYYPELNPKVSEGEKLNIFFWQRSDEVNWDLVKKLVKKEDVVKFTLRKAFDRNDSFTLPSAVEKKNYNLKIVEGWLEKEEYMEMLKTSNLFLAPRGAEGIGLSFLEAMSYNIPILAPDAPTMNEYITHGINGYLYDINDPKSIDFSTIATVRNNLRKGMEQGKIEWEASKKPILSFIKKRNRKRFNLYRSLFHQLIFVKDILTDLKKTIYK